MKDDLLGKLLYDALSKSQKDKSRGGQTLGDGLLNLKFWIPRRQFGESSEEQPRRKEKEGQGELD